MKEFSGKWKIGKDGSMVLKWKKRKVTPLTYLDTSNKEEQTLGMNKEYLSIKRSIRNAIRTPKWWYQRITRGYSDRDMWNADTYLAGVFAGVLQWYIDSGIGVSMAYKDDDDMYGTDVESMVIRRDADYLNHISIFTQYLNNGLAWDEEDVKKSGGVLDKDIKASVHWLADHFTELWDQESFMIRVTVDLVPLGEEDNSKTIGKFVLANDGEGDVDYADYGFVYSDDLDGEREGTVKNFKRSEGIWKLISECLSNPGEVDNEEFMDVLWDRMNKNA